MEPGVRASRQTAVAHPRALNFAVEHGMGVELSSQRAAVSANVGISGVTALLVLLAGLWAVDRYVMPAVGGR